MSESAPIADLAAKRTTARKRSLLPSTPPPPGTPREEVAAWLSAALGLGSDPVQSAARYGRHDDARLVVVLRSGQRVTFEAQRDAFEGRTLVRRFVLATGATIPTYGPADAQQVATALVRLADLIDDGDDRAEALEWARSFLAGAQRNTIEVADAGTPPGRYEAISALIAWKAPGDVPPYAPPADRSALILDTATGDRWARASDVAAHVRYLAGRPISWPALHGRMVEIGWQHRGQVEQRQPGGHARAKVHIYAAPGGWDAD
ncbi:MAG: hypothetical protein U0R70_06405 [Solirubrobacteraceae bacterium]